MSGYGEVVESKSTTIVIRGRIIDITVNRYRESHIENPKEAWGYEVLINGILICGYAPYVFTNGKSLLPAMKRISTNEIPNRKLFISEKRELSVAMRQLNAEWLIEHVIRNS